MYFRVNMCWCPPVRSAPEGEQKRGDREIHNQTWCRIIASQLACWYFSRNNLPANSSVPMMCTHKQKCKWNCEGCKMICSGSECYFIEVRAGVINSLSYRSNQQEEKATNCRQILISLLPFIWLPKHNQFRNWTRAGMLPNNKLTLNSSRRSALDRSQLLCIM